jgi:hypothetical protein
VSLTSGAVRLAAVLLAVASTASAQLPRGVEAAGVAVRYAEGTVHGFVELRAISGALLAHGDALQLVRDGGVVETRMDFHFADSSVFQEQVTFTQQGVFVMQTYHLIQRGPAFANDLEATVQRSGQYVVKTKAHKDNAERQYIGTLDLPADVSNGMVITIAKNIGTRDTHTVHIVAFTPEPRVVGLEIAPTGSQRMMVGAHAETAVHYKLKPKLGPALRLFASVAGKAPPDSDVWIIADDVPAFVRFEGPMYSGPVWRLSLTSPSWPSEETKSR